MRDVRRALRTDARVTDAVYDAGYGSNSRFYERTAPRLGMKPSTYKKGGAGMAIQYATVDSPLGRLLRAMADSPVALATHGMSVTAIKVPPTRQQGGARPPAFASGERSRPAS